MPNLQTEIIINHEPEPLTGDSWRDEQVTKANNLNAFIFRLCPALAMVTGQAWQVVCTRYDEQDGEPRHYTYKLRLQDDLEFKLHFSQPYNEPRKVEISGFGVSANFAADFGSINQYFTPRSTQRIKVSMDREPQAIAKDINVRLLPHYRAELIEVREARERWLSYMAASEKAAAMIREQFSPPHFDAKKYYQNRSSSRPDVQTHAMHLERGEIHVKNREFDSRLFVQLEIPCDQLPALLAFMRGK